MIPFFAHHDGGLLRSLDFLGLQPVTVIDHVVAFAAYGLVLAVLVGAGFGTRLVFRKVSRQTDPRTS